MNKRAIIYARTAYKDRGSDWSQIKKQLQACSKLAKKSGLIITYDIGCLSRDYTNCIRFLFLLKTKNIDLLTVVPGEDWVKEVWTKYYKAALSQAIKRGIAFSKTKNDYEKQQAIKTK